MDKGRGFRESAAAKKRVSIVFVKKKKANQVFTRNGLLLQNHYMLRGTAPTI